MLYYVNTFLDKKWQILWAFKIVKSPPTHTHTHYLSEGGGIWAFDKVLVRNDKGWTSVAVDPLSAGGCVYFINFTPFGNDVTISVIIKCL